MLWCQIRPRDSKDFSLTKVLSHYNILGQDDHLFMPIGCSSHDYQWNPNITYSPNKDTDAREEGHWRYALISGRGEIQQSKTFVVLTLHRLHFLPLSIREAKMHGQ